MCVEEIGLGLFVILYNIVVSIHQAQLSLFSSETFTYDPSSQHWFGQHVTVYW